MQIKRIILIILAVLILGAVYFFWYLTYQEKQLNKFKKNQQEEFSKKEDKSESIKKENENNIKSIKTVLESFDDSGVTIQFENDELYLKFSEEGVVFLQQINQEEGLIIEREVGLLEIPLNKEVLVSYDDNKKEVLMIKDELIQADEEIDIENSKVTKIIKAKEILSIENGLVEIINEKGETETISLVTENISEILIQHINE